MNELIILTEIIFAFGCLTILSKLFGKSGCIAWIAIATILANIQAVKSIALFGGLTTCGCGCVMFASTFLATDILTENYSEKDAKKGVFVGIVADIIAIAAMQISLLYKPSDIDMMNGTLHTLFMFSMRVSSASLVMYIIANYADVVLFEKIRKRTGEKKMWLRNNVSTIVCNCTENFGFAFLAFYGVYDVRSILTIAVSTSVVEMVIALCDTPFLYIAKRIHRPEAD